LSTITIFFKDVTFFEYSLY